MKEYMMIFIGDSYEDLGLSPEEMQGKMGKWFEWSNVMQEAGVLRGGHALHSEVRHVSGSKRTITDKAGSEVKELIGGYYIVEAKNMDEVVTIAEGYPDYDLGGTVEIREIMVFDR
ncbi:MAG: YciI family protein [Flavobacteriales bacterium]